MSPELKRSIDKFIASNKVVVFMKGEKASPQVSELDAWREQDRRLVGLLLNCFVGCIGKLMSISTRWANIVR